VHYFRLLRRILTVSILRRTGRQPFRMLAPTAKLLSNHGMVVEASH
jgi:hypothetical protein